MGLMNRFMLTVALYALAVVFTAASCFTLTWSLIGCQSIYASGALCQAVG